MARKAVCDRRAFPTGEMDIALAVERHRAWLALGINLTANVGSDRAGAPMKTHDAKLFTAKLNNKKPPRNFLRAFPLPCLTLPSLVQPASKITRLSETGSFVR